MHASNSFTASEPWASKRPDEQPRSGDTIEHSGFFRSFLKSASVAIIAACVPTSLRRPSQVSRSI